MTVWMCYWYAPQNRSPLLTAISSDIRGSLDGVSVCISKLCERPRPLAASFCMMCPKRPQLFCLACKSKPRATSLSCENLYSVAYNSEEEFEFRARNSRRQRGETAALFTHFLTQKFTPLSTSLRVWKGHSKQYETHYHLYCNVLLSKSPCTDVNRISEKSFYRGSVYSLPYVRKHNKLVKQVSKLFWNKLFELC